MTYCPVCPDKFQLKNYLILASHFMMQSNKSDSDHVRWLNQNISKNKLDESELSSKLTEFFHWTINGLPKWIKQKFVKKFYSATPHPFVLALQRPTRVTLLGYVFEHQHFLRQWVRSCSFIIAKTDQMDVTLYELDNINTEFTGISPEIPSHYEYLLRMGESLGVYREQILETPPLPATQEAINFWQKLGETGHWLEIMAAMHSLELIAYRNIKDEGATLTYFDPDILQSPDYTQETKGFLQEGYEADLTHADEALALIEKYATSADLIEMVQNAFLKSIEMFDRYLLARLERSKDFES